MFELELVVFFFYFTVLHIYNIHIIVLSYTFQYIYIYIYYCEVIITVLNSSSPHFCTLCRSPVLCKTKNASKHLVTAVFYYYFEYSYFCNYSTLLLEMIEFFFSDTMTFTCACKKNYFYILFFTTISAAIIVSFFDVSP